MKRFCSLMGRGGLCLLVWMLSGGLGLRSKFFISSFLMMGVRLIGNSEKEELDLQLRAVPEIEARILELTAS